MTKPGPCPFLEMKFYQNVALVTHSDAAPFLILNGGAE